VASLLAVAGLIACNDAGLFEAFSCYGHHLRPSKTAINCARPMCKPTTSSMPAWATSADTHVFDGCVRPMVLGCL
jgi:hypothetical protein